MDGVVQSVDPDDALSGYWQAMIPERRPESALLLGLGGGTVAHLLVRRFGPLPITGVELSSEMIALARREFALAELPLTIVQADALQFVHSTGERFGYIAVDLYRGNRLVRGVLALPFLRALAARLLPGGTVACNLFCDAHLEGRLQRLERLFERLRLDLVGANAIVHARPRRPQR
ncbi:MAG TPA: methyltransferase domain-containing protein [Dehalococcoidia bacterium]